MKISFFLMAVAALTVTAPGQELLYVWDINDGILTDQGGFYNHFMAGTSTADVKLVPQIRRGPGGRSMQVDYRKTDDGYCGVWMHCFNEEQARQDHTATGLDVARHPWLSFHVKGAQGGEQFLIQAADPAWNAKEDSRPAGSVTQYLPDGISTHWQEVVVPLGDFRLGAPEICGLTFNFARQGKGTVYIDDLCFKQQADTPVPMRGTPDRTADTDLQKPVRAMWVWHTAPLLTNPVYRADFFDFCRNHHISDLFLQLLYSYEKEHTPGVTCLIGHKPELRAFIRQAHERGMTIYALDGHPEYVLRPNHTKVLAQVQALLDFNAAAPPGEQLDGIHLDNEPYLLPGFESVLQEQILLEFLELNQAIKDKLEQAGSNMDFGVDIPFWFDERPGECTVRFNGIHQDAAKHIIDLVDHLGIMDYRNFAGGADGMIKHAQGEMAYANRQGTPVYLGVETFRDTYTPFWYVCAIPADKWDNFVQQHKKLLLHRDFQGFRLKRYSDNRYQYLGLGQDPADKVTDAFRAALFALKNTLATNALDQALTDSVELESWVRRDDGAQGVDIVTVESGTHAPLQAICIAGRMPPKTSFAGKNKSALEDALAETARHYGGQPALKGFAIHYYRTYRDLPD